MKFHQLPGDEYFVMGDTSVLRSVSEMGPRLIFNKSPLVWFGGDYSCDI